MNIALIILQVVSGILLCVTILMQPKGAGIGSTFGGSSSFHRSRRGVEKVLFRATIILSVIFVGASMASIVLS